MAGCDKGISVYAGLGHSAAQNAAYLEQAASLGYRRLFTSLHIPEADPSGLADEFARLIAIAVRFGFHVTADISPRSFPMFDASLTNLEPFCRLGLHALRLDFGFTAAEIARLTRKSPLTIALNASALDEAALDELATTRADLSRIEAWHNYYPRPETGLSLPLYRQRSQLWQQRGIPVFTFIPSRENPRPPIGAGLPTLEQHRSLTPLVAAKHLAASGLTDAIVFGDPLAGTSELTAVAACDTTCIELRVEARDDLHPHEQMLLWATRHTNRLDPGEAVIRSQEARDSCPGIIPARAPQPRPQGAVTIDNEQYRRYMGELQIVQQDLPPDERVNRVAMVVPEERFLLTLLQPGAPFRLKPA
ncbi:MAG TPA: MupG family TIM beta-alpha barrel fold protein [Patescibacteria group bacterium]|nr:MupG family TIM beta-alpha barrel fold protein [Patescibacteria group bacterium]